MNKAVPNGWLERPLGELARIRRGASPRPIDSPRWFADDGPGWVRISDVTRANGRLRNTEQRLSPEGVGRSVRVRAGNVLMSICATIGEPVVVEMDACIHDGFVVFDQFEKALDTHFLLHLLRAISPSFRAVGQTGTQANLNTDIVKRKGVLVPRTTNEQSRIAAVLDTVDEAIAKTGALIAKLRQVQAGVLHDILTRGIDEKGQIRDPAAHPEQFWDSPLGRLPRKWQLLRLEGASVKVQDGTHFSPKSTAGPRRYVTSKNIRFGFLDLTDCGWISETEHREIYKRCDVQKHDILLTKDGANTGNAALNILNEEFSLLSSVALIRCRRGFSHYEFLLNYLISPLGQKRLKDMMSGNAITRLTLQKIKNFVIPLPPFDEQINIAEQLRACGDNIVSIENELLKLTKIKSGFMSDLLTGRVRVPEGII